MFEAGTRENPATKPAIAIVYLAGFLQGITLVSFPASSIILKEVHGITDAQYGALFLPQVALAIIGALGGGVLARRIGLKVLLWIALLGNTLSQLALAGSLWVRPELAFASVLLGSACVGFGFGLSGAPLNSYPPIFFPGRHHTAVVALHTLIGLGFATGPLLAGRFIAADFWVGFPVALFVISLILTATAFAVKLPGEGRGQVTQVRDDSRKRPIKTVSFWIFAAIAMLYAFAEGTFSNWVVIYLHESKQLSETVANMGLSTFWGAMVVGRLLTSVIVLWVSATAIWLMLPIFMITAFLLLPLINSAGTGIALFAFAGLACSAFFPLTITLISKRFPEHVAWVSSMIIASLTVGIGIGSFVIGPLRQLLPLQELYRLSAFYPGIVLLLAISLLKTEYKHSSAK
jgi:fucose permease